MRDDKRFAREEGELGEKMREVANEVLETLSEP